MPYFFFISPFTQHSGTPTPHGTIRFLIIMEYICEDRHWRVMAFLRTVLS